jgi:uncharacterized protein YjbI with pentapeptide repeats
MNKTLEDQTFVRCSLRRSSIMVLFSRKLRVANFEEFLIYEDFPSVDFSTVDFSSVDFPSMGIFHLCEISYT